MPNARAASLSAATLLCARRDDFGLPRAGPAHAAWQSAAASLTFVGDATGSMTTAPSRAYASALASVRCTWHQRGSTCFCDDVAPVSPLCTRNHAHHGPAPAPSSHLSPPLPQSGKATTKAAAPAKKAAAKKAPVKAAAKPAAATGEDPLYAARPKNFGVGRDTQHKRDVSRFVKWPVYVRLQRQKRILYERLKTPPAIAQFKKPLDRAEALPLFKLLAKYKPETVAEKKLRLKAAAEAKAAGKEAAAGAPPPVLKFGLNHITYLVEQKKARAAWRGAWCAGRQGDASGSAVRRGTRFPRSGAALTAVRRHLVTPPLTCCCRPSWW